VEINLSSTETPLLPNPIQEGRFKMNRGSFNQFMKYKGYIHDGLLWRKQNGDVLSYQELELLNDEFYDFTEKWRTEGD